MARPFKTSTVESHDWDARADRMSEAAENLPPGKERDEALHKLALMRAGAAMKRALS